ncbi:CDP-glucose 4,6-dehydratase [bacterium]|jgi:CDP-glucose 4,6-dehydratase|nr:CDP-glucose 4,6-dehydratase [bacterium]
MNSISPSFWHSKKVLVTGHTGFKGSWLSLWLQTMGADLCGIALPPPTEPSLFAQAKVADGMRHQLADVRDFEKIEKIFQSFQPDIVLHLAAQPLVRESYKAPIETYSTNVMGTVHVLEASRRTKSVRAVINVTTDKCYENREWVWGYRENEPIGGHDPYSSSKGCSELVSAAYRKSFFEDAEIQVATARAGNVIGGGDWARDRLIPDIIKSIQENIPTKIRNPNAIRPWQHVLEPLSGYLLLAEGLYNKKDGMSGAWNFGPRDEDAQNVQWVANELSKKMGQSPIFLPDPKNHPHEANFLKLDISKAKNKLGWEPRWSLNTALDRIVDWNRSLNQKEDIRKKSVSQILEYNKTGVVL